MTRVTAFVMGVLATILVVCVWTHDLSPFVIGFIVGLLVICVAED
jgi:hypothetical protein